MREAGQAALTAGQRRVRSLIAVAFDGHLVPFEQGRATVSITRATPEQDCRFVNLRQREPAPSPPGSAAKCLPRLDTAGRARRLLIDASNARSGS